MTTIKTYDSQAHAEKVDKIIDNYKPGKTRTLMLEAHLRQAFAKGEKHGLLQAIKMTIDVLTAGK